MESLHKAIELCGNSQAGLAKRISENLPAGADPVTPQQVWNWLNRDGVVPAVYCPTIEKICKGQVLCEDLNDKADWSYLRTTKERATLPYTIPAGAKAREAKGGSRQPIDPKKEML